MTMTIRVYPQGYSPDFPPSKLKTGCGEQCIWVLDRLSDEALKAKTFAWKKSVPFQLPSVVVAAFSSITLADNNNNFLLTASVGEWLRAWDTLTMFEATVCGRS